MKKETFDQFMKRRFETLKDLYIKKNYGDFLYYCQDIYEEKEFYKNLELKIWAKDEHKNNKRY